MKAENAIHVALDLVGGLQTHVAGHVSHRRFGWELVLVTGYSMHADSQVLRSHDIDAVTG